MRPSISDETARVLRESYSAQLDVSGVGPAPDFGAVVDAPDVRYGALVEPVPNQQPSVKTAVVHIPDTCLYCGPMVRCGKCGNPTCSGGCGELPDGSECDACESAYAMDRKLNP